MNKNNNDHIDPDLAWEYIKFFRFVVVVLTLLFIVLVYFVVSLFLGVL